MAPLLRLKKMLLKFEDQAHAAALYGIEILQLRRAEVHRVVA